MTDRASGPPIARGGPFFSGSDAGRLRHGEPIRPPAVSPLLLLLAWLAVIVFPVLLFQRAALMVIDHEESERVLAARGALLEELGGFIDSLRPERRIADTFQAIERRLGFPARMSGRDFRYMPDAAPQFAPTRLLPRLKNEIIGRFGAMPLLLAAVGPDCSTIDLCGDPKYFNDGSLPSPRNWQPLMMWLARLDKRAAWSDPVAVAQFHQRFGSPQGALLLNNRVQGIAKYLLRDSFPRLEWGDPQCSFSTAFGGDRLWYYCQFVPASPASGAAILGGFLAVFRNQDLPAPFFVKPAMRKKDRGVFRNLSMHTPHFRRRNGDLQLISPLPADLLQPDFAGTGNRTVFDEPGQLATPPYLFVRRPARDIEHPLREWLPALRLSGTAFILGSGLFFLLFGTGLFQIPLRIRGQLGLAIALGMLMPMGAFWLVTRGYLGVLQRQERTRMLNDLRLRLGDIEQLTISHSRGEHRRFVEDKTGLSGLIDGPDSAIIKGLEAFRIRNHSTLAHLIRSDGREWFNQGSLPGAIEISKEHIQKMAESARLLSFRLFTDLRVDPPPAVTSSGSPTIWSRSHLQMSTLIDQTEVNSLLQNDGFLFDTRFSGVRQSRVIQGFVPRAGPSPQPVRGILFVNQPAESLIQPFFERLTARSRFFRQSIPGFYVRVAIFQLGNADRQTVVPGISWPRSAAFDPLLRSLAQKALISSRGNYVKASDRPRDSLAVTRMFGKLPYIAVALAEPTNTQHQETSTLQAFGMLGAYTLLILTLLTRFLQQVFVAPLRAIETGSRAIADGDFSLNLDLTTGDEFQLLATEFNTMTRGLRERERLQRFVSSDLLQSIRQGGNEHLQPGGERTPVTVMFCHIRDFSLLMRTAPTETTISLLNRWFSAAEHVLGNHQGVIDKFMGDAFMAVFRPAPEIQNSPASRSCHAAIELVQRLSAMNTESLPLAHPILGIGIGIATGVAISGRIGSRFGRLDFTVIGDTVNLAARLESLARTEPGNRILIDEKTHSEIVSALSTNSLGSLQVKGKTRPVDIFQLQTESPV